MYADALLVAFWYILIDTNDAGVYYGHDCDAALWAQSPGAIALLLPSDPAGQTVAWAMCCDAHGAPEADVTVEVRRVVRQVGGGGGE